MNVALQREDPVLTSSTWGFANEVQRQEVRDPWRRNSEVPEAMAAPGSQDTYEGAPWSTGKRMGWPGIAGAQELIDSGAWEPAEDAESNLPQATLTWGDGTQEGIGGVSPTTARGHTHEIYSLGTVRVDRELGYRERVCKSIVDPPVRGRDVQPAGHWHGMLPGSDMHSTTSV